MSFIWVALIVTSTLIGALNGRAEAVGAAAFEGAAASVELAAAILGATCLWSGVGELMRRNGMAAALTRLLRPVLSRLFPSAAGCSGAMDAISANVGANLLGLGNAATPAGIRAAALLAGARGTLAASDDLCTLVVLNTASIQLIPSTVAAVRAAAGASAPMDILPAVWISSAASVLAGLGAAAVLKRLWH